MASLADPGGRVLAGRYRLGEPLGQGGCATVYAAVDEHLDREVAIKVWDAPTDEPAREARIAARVQHPGVVVVHDAHADADPSYLVMERVSGCSLADALRDGPLPEGRAVHVVAQLCRTLSLVHQDGIVHGDVKPGNVLLGPEDRVTLTDFGVASPTRSRFRSEARGTPPYLSPEQVQGQHLTPATDVYASGLLLLECLTATRAFPGEGEQSALARLRDDPAVPSWVAPDLARLVREMTARDPAHRPPAEEVAARLEERVPQTRTMPVPLAPVTTSIPVDPPRRWLLAVGAALLAVVGVLAMTGQDRPTRSPAAPAAPAPVAATPVATPHVARIASPAAVAPKPRPAAVVDHGHGHKHKGRKG